MPNKFYLIICVVHLAVIITDRNLDLEQYADSPFWRKKREQRNSEEDGYGTFILS